MFPCIELPLERKAASYPTCACGVPKILPPPHLPPPLKEIPLAEWQERGVAGARDCSTPGDAACSCGWGNRWTLFGAGHDTNLFFFS